MWIPLLPLPVRSIQIGLMIFQKDFKITFLFFIVYHMSCLVSEYYCLIPFSSSDVIFNTTLWFFSARSIAVRLLIAQKRKNVSIMMNFTRFILTVIVPAEKNWYKIVVVCHMCRLTLCHALFHVEFKIRSDKCRATPSFPISNGLGSRRSLCLNSK